MIVYGSGISDGNVHSHENLPVIMLGRGAGNIKTGRHIEYKQGPPMTNLYLTLLGRLGVPTEKLGDSNGRLDHLSEIW
jgi:hypothetical protein